MTKLTKKIKTLPVTVGYTSALAVSILD